MKRIIIDLDGTLTINNEAPYPDKPVNFEVLKACRKYKEMGFEIAKKLTEKGVVRLVKIAAGANI